ncbi:sensor histidine kinase [Microbacterium sediminis]|uniref:sensor histidine kinase n=1 Tax=Microbacterium sediminis TaxID=904291 RepID=UPI000AF44482|nr:ATP-binding protein [Microbacterium sediminis]QBR73556.1 histidine kinase [Microbacterium sediminis]
MRFATRVLLMQLGAAFLIVLVCLAAFAAFAVGQLRAEAESTALGIARSVASDPDVRAQAAAYAGRAGLDAAALEAGDLQRQAAEVADRTGALFVVIANDRGLRLAHPDPAELGRELSTAYAPVLRGSETIDWAHGTLGDSARAKVPVTDPASGEVIGLVSVGFAPSRVYGDVPAVLGVVAGVALVAVAAAVGVALLIRRRLEALTRGVQPDELEALLQSRAAVLDGVHDGVLAIGPDRVVRACNPSAVRVFGGIDPTGSDVGAAGLPRRLVRAVERVLAGEARVEEQLVLEDRVAYVDVRRARNGADDLGAVAVLRDRTDVLALAERLEAVRAATSALRVQRHEFANRMHAAAGMLAAGRVDEAERMIAEFAERGAIPDEGALEVDEPFLASFLAAKAAEASERGVELRIADDTLLVGVVAQPEDVAAVLGNLVDNAISAAVAGAEPRWVSVSLLDDGDTLALTVTDSGRGVDDPNHVFENARRQEDAAPADAVHGRGIGLPLARRFARRRGGALWLVEARGEGHGAVFAARLPGAMSPRSAPEEAIAP